MVRASASRARACGGLDEGEARPRNEHRPRDPEVGVGRGDLRVVRDLRRAADVGGRGEEVVLDEGAEEDAGAPELGLRPRAARGPRSMDRLR